MPRKRQAQSYTTQRISLCSCFIKLRGDIRQRVYRDPIDNPISWPEVFLLQHAHGHDAIEELKVVSEPERSVDEELSRLRAKYGDKLFATVYPGARPAIEMIAPPNVRRAGRVGTFKQNAAAEDAEEVEDDTEEDTEDADPAELAAVFGEGKAQVASAS